MTIFDAFQAANRRLHICSCGDVTAGCFFFKKSIKKAPICGVESKLLVTSQMVW